MFILITILEFVMLAIALVVIAWQRPQFRYTWLIAVGGGFLTWVANGFAFFSLKSFSGKGVTASS